ncbi:unnamed protein product [Symbiodinium sp. CCMP2456]|nr:unnamed protein product [Symbiodinium sp. CCMP2456]
MFRLRRKRKPPHEYWSSKRLKKGGTINGQAASCGYLLLNDAAEDDYTDYERQLKDYPDEILLALESNLVSGRPVSEVRGRGPASKKPPPGIRSRGGGFYVARVMFKDLRIVTARAPLHQALQWLTSLSSLRCTACTRASNSHEPLSLPELASEMERGDGSLDLRFETVLAKSTFRFGTPSTSNLPLALKLREELLSITASTPKRSLAKVVSKWQTAAKARVLAEKESQPVKQRKLLAAVAAERTRRKFQVGNQLQQMLGYPGDDRHAVAQLRDATPGMFGKMRALLRQLVRPRTMQARLSRRPRGILPAAVRHVRPLHFLSIKEVLQVSAISIASYDVAMDSLRLRLRSFVYEPSFLDGPKESRRGRTLTMPAAKQVTLLLEMLRAPHLSPLFFEVDLRKVPFDVESMGELPGVLATMSSLSLLQLRTPSQEFLASTSRCRIFDAMPAGASLEFHKDQRVVWFGSKT